ncbi:MAG TPA: hypothetical protein PK523_00745 [Elusimicrobiales bacterium]|nr:hypothetical protein [Elusimicrobiales bacterium]
MKNRILAAIFAAAAFLPAAPASAQQLYVSEIVVGAGGGTYCDAGLGTDRSFETSLTGDPWNDSALIEFERPRAAYPGGCLSLCVQIECVVPSTPTLFGVDELSFEIFKFGPGGNPLDPASTPPIRTINLYNIGQCNQQSGAPTAQTIGGPGHYYCTAWDGMYNINGMFGKTNGQYGFRATVKTNQVSATAGNISIQQTSAYPGENQVPIQINVTNIHSVKSTPTVVGKITGVAAQPYNILYRLSRDATTTINIFAATGTGTLPLVRTLVDRLPRVGEGTPDGTLTNGDFWDGRDNNGRILPAGLYLARIEAESADMWAFGPGEYTDIARPTTVQIGLDPLQVTDVAIKPLGASSTDLATISYMLTEAATVHVGIYPPGTAIEVNASSVSASITPLRLITEQKDRRTTVTTIWDGRDSSGNPVCDGDYVYAIWAELPSGDWTVRTNKVMVGAVPVARGLPVALLNPSSTVIGSSPTAAMLDPFYFRYTPQRDALVNLTIKSMDGTTVVRRLVQNEPRAANFSNRDLWDGRDEFGNYVASGTYLAELAVTDPLLCAAVKTSTVTALIPVDMFRIVDVRSTSLLGGTSSMATIGFELSQTMWMTINIYAAGSTQTAAGMWPWEDSVTLTPVYSISGVRPGRFRITEYWDGRDSDGRLMPDGRYPFTLVAKTSGTAGGQMMYATDKVSGYIDITRGQIIFAGFDVIPSIPTMYNSSDSVKLPPYEITYSLNRQSTVTVQVMTLEIPPREVAHVASGFRDGDILYQDFWDGKDNHGNFVPCDTYNVRIIAEDVSALLTQRTTVQMTIDACPLRIYDVSIVPLTQENPAIISYQVSEAMKVATKIYKPGTNRSLQSDPGVEVPGTIVKRIIGVRPARTQITEYWDGTDLTLTRVPDGSYVFQIYGTTDTDNLNTLTGSLTHNYVRADDIVTANIPLTKGGVVDLCGEFEAGSFFFPNPYTGTSGRFRVKAPFGGKISMRLYNLAGDLVYKYDFGDQPGDNQAEHPWPRTNQQGKTVAPGVYLAVLRFEATQGTREVCQTVKKILIP